MDTKGGKVGKREGKMSAKGTREEKICAIAKKYFFMKVLFILHSAPSTLVSPGLKGLFVREIRSLPFFAGVVPKRKAASSFEEAACFD